MIDFESPLVVSGALSWDAGAASFAATTAGVLLHPAHLGTTTPARLRGLWPASSGTASPARLGRLNPAQLKEDA